MTHKRRIITDGHQNCKYAVQEFDERLQYWEFVKYEDTINILGNEYDSEPYPKWYDTIEEIESLLKDNEICATVILGVNDK